ncbi:AdoMet_MTases domain containing protein [Burkholderiales bacterium]
MSDWTSGYVADIGYTFGYYSELNPLRARLAFLNQGLVCPTRFENACELGFGQGLSANIHASASCTKWWGTDFNPSQASFAQELARASANGASLFDEAFAEFCNRSDLPEFDFIGLHGIWSWISDENRGRIVDFVRRKLRVGGVLYVSYNTLPGWATFAPMRHLMTEHAEVIGAEGRGIVNRINDAIEFADKLLATNPIFARANPFITERIKKLKDQNRHYLAHEYFNRDWHPMHFSTMAEWLEPAKVQYACSANYIDHIEVANLTSEQQEFLKEIPDRMFRESVRDFMVNQQFRRDYWVKGSRKLTISEHEQQLRAQRIILVQPRTNVKLKVTGHLGEANLSAAVYEPILGLLEDHKPKSLGEVADQLALSNIRLGQVVQAATALVGAGYCLPVSHSEDSLPSSIALNRHIMQRAHSSNEIGFLSSTVLEGGFSISRFQQLFLLHYMDFGLRDKVSLAKAAWKALESQNQRILKEGKTLSTPEENIRELEEQAEEFLSSVLPILSELKAVQTR